MKFYGIGVTPEAWEGKTFTEFDKWCQGKLISTKRKEAWEEIQKSIPKKEKPKKVEKPNK